MIILNKPPHTLVSRRLPVSFIGYKSRCWCISSSPAGDTPCRRCGSSPSGGGGGGGGRRERDWRRVFFGSRSRAATSRRWGSATVVGRKRPRGENCRLGTRSRRRRRDGTWITADRAAPVRPFTTAGREMRQFALGARITSAAETFLRIYTGVLREVPRRIRAPIAG